MRLGYRNALNIITALLAGSWIFLVAITLIPQFNDARQYWQMSLNLRETGNPYVAASTSIWSVYYYAPLIAYVFQPFSFVDTSVSQYAWFWFNTIILIGCIALTIWCSQSTSARTYWGVVLVAMAIAPPTRLTLQLGQISLIVALLLIGVWATRRYPVVAGGFLALAVGLRIFPALLILPFFFQRHRNVAWWTLGIGGGLLLITLIGDGWEPYRILANSPPYPYSAEFNISWLGLFSRLFIQSDYGIPVAHLPLLALSLTVLMSVGVIGWAIWCTRLPQSQDSALSYSLWLCVMLIVSPTNGYYSLVLLLFPLLVIVQSLDHTPHPTIRNWLLIATALVCIPSGWTGFHPVLYQSLHQGWGNLLLAPSFYGLIIYLILLSWLLLRR